MLIIAVVTVVPLIVVAVPIVLALGTRRRSRLQRSVAVPFVATAVAVVVLAALYPEAYDQNDWVPMLQMFGLPSDRGILGELPTQQEAAL